MPPIAMWSSVCADHVAGRRRRRSAASSAAAGAGPSGAETSGAWPKPPWRGSNARAQVPAAPAAAAPASRSPASGSSSPQSLQTCSVICAGLRHRSRRGAFCQASASVQQHALEAGPAIAIVRREVGAAVERLQVRRQEHRHRPAALAGQQLHGGHVDLIEVGPFLAIDLDADEVLVEDAGDLVVLEALVLHDVAPVAGRVADAEEDRPIELAGPRASASAPQGYQSTGLWACCRR